MVKQAKKILAGTLVLSALMINTTKPALADGIILNKSTTQGVNVRAEEDTNSEVLGGIEDFSLYEIKEETDDWYEIEFEGKRGYVGKPWFFRVNHTNIIEPTNLKKEANSDSSNQTDYKLQVKTKVTILEFVPDSDFVKVSYDEAYKDNKKINLIDIKALENNNLVYSLADSENLPKVQTITLGSSPVVTPDVVTLSSRPETVEMTDEVVSNYEGPVEGYVKFSSLALSKRDQEEIEKYKKFYDEMNEHIKTTKAAEEEQRNRVTEYQTIQYVTTTTYETVAQEQQNQAQTQSSAASPIQSTTVSTNRLTVPVTGSPVGIELYKFATQFVGNRYVLGGTDLYNGIDCSGFTMQIYRTIGIELPHFAQWQQRYGVEIPYGQEQAGDLLFFGTGLNNITHVGMADGNGNMIHASSPKNGIKINPIYQRPVSIKRLVK